MTDHNRHHDQDQEERIRQLKQQAERASSGTMRAWESDQLSADERERFWRRVIALETEPVSSMTDNFRQLIAAGIELPQPDALDDEQLPDKLWEVIEALADMNVFLSQTNHLSDRELYTALWTDVLRQEVPERDIDENAEWYVDILGGWSPDDTLTYLKYYADEKTRQEWRTDYPDLQLPEHVDPPYDRDRHLP